MNTVKDRQTERLPTSIFSTGWETDKRLYGVDQ